ncbi:MAG: uracil-DNA glycosylase [Planctomycetota bacterium]
MATESDQEIATLSGAQLQRALLARLRFEQALGLESVRPVMSPPRVKLEEPRVPPSLPTTSPATPLSPIISPATSVATVATPITTAARWRDIEARVKTCAQCALHKGRNNVVFGAGNREAHLVFVGEAPGYDEDLQGLPFVGKAGQLLNRIVAAMGLNREDVYICNIVKCRPPENRAPLPDEIAACNPCFVEQIELIKPKVIVALGNSAAKTLLKTTQGITSLRGHWFNYRGIPVMPTYHPAFLLYQYIETNRKAVWDDMKQVMEKLK